MEDLLRKDNPAKVARHSDQQKNDGHHRSEETTEFPETSNAGSTSSIKNPKSTTCDYELLDELVNRINASEDFDSSDESMPKLQNSSIEELNLFQKQKLFNKADELLLTTFSSFEEDTEIQDPNIHHFINSGPEIEPDEESEGIFQSAKAIVEEQNEVTEVDKNAMELFQRADELLQAQDNPLCDHSQTVNASRTVSETMSPETTSLISETISPETSVLSTRLETNQQTPAITLPTTISSSTMKNLITTTLSTADTSLVKEAALKSASETKNPSFKENEKCEFCPNDDEYDTKSSTREPDVKRSNREARKSGLNHLYPKHSKNFFRRRRKAEVPKSTRVWEKFNWGIPRRSKKTTEATESDTEKKTSQLSEPPSVKPKSAKSEIFSTGKLQTTTEEAVQTNLDDKFLNGIAVLEKTKENETECEVCEEEIHSTETTEEIVSKFEPSTTFRTPANATKTEYNMQTHDTAEKKEVTAEPSNQSLRSREKLKMNEKTSTKLYSHLSKGKSEHTSSESSVLEEETREISSLPTRKEKENKTLAKVEEATEYNEENKDTAKIERTNSIKTEQESEHTIETHVSTAETLETEEDTKGETGAEVEETTKYIENKISISKNPKSRIPSTTESPKSRARLKPQENNLPSSTEAESNFTSSITEETEAIVEKSPENNEKTASNDKTTSAENKSGKVSTIESQEEKDKLRENQKSSGVSTLLSAHFTEEESEYYSKFPSIKEVLNTSLLTTVQEREEETVAEVEKTTEYNKNIENAPENEETNSRNTGYENMGTSRPLEGSEKENILSLTTKPNSYSTKEESDHTTETALRRDKTTNEQAENEQNLMKTIELPLHNLEFPNKTLLTITPSATSFSLETESSEWFTVELEKSSKSLDVDNVTFQLETNPEDFESFSYEPALQETSEWYTVVLEKSSQSEENYTEVPIYTRVVIANKEYDDDENIISVKENSIISAANKSSAVERQKDIEPEYRDYEESSGAGHSTNEITETQTLTVESSLSQKETHSLSRTEAIEQTEKETTLYTEERARKQNQEKTSPYTFSEESESTFKPEVGITNMAEFTKMTVDHAETKTLESEESTSNNEIDLTEQMGHINASLESSEEQNETQNPSYVDSRPATSESLENLINTTSKHPGSSSENETSLKTQQETTTHFYISTKNMITVPEVEETDVVEISSEIGEEEEYIEISSPLSTSIHEFIYRQSSSEQSTEKLLTVASSSEHKQAEGETHFYISTTAVTIPEIVPRGSLPESSEGFTLEYASDKQTEGEKFTLEKEEEKFSIGGDLLGHATSEIIGSEGDIKSEESTLTSTQAKVQDTEFTMGNVEENETNRRTKATDEFDKEIKMTSESTRYTSKNTPLSQATTEASNTILESTESAELGETSYIMEGNENSQNKGESEESSTISLEPKFGASKIIIGFETEKESASELMIGTGINTNEPIDNKASEKSIQTVVYEISEMSGVSPENAESEQSTTDLEDELKLETSSTVNTKLSSSEEAESQIITQKTKEESHTETNIFKSTESNFFETETEIATLIHSSHEAEFAKSLKESTHETQESEISSNSRIQELFSTESTPSESEAESETFTLLTPHGRTKETKPGLEGTEYKLHFRTSGEIESEGTGTVWNSEQVENESSIKEVTLENTEQGTLPTKLNSLERHETRQHSSHINLDHTLVIEENLESSSFLEQISEVTEETLSSEQEVLEETILTAIHGTTQESSFNPFQSSAEVIETEIVETESEEYGTKSSLSTFETEITQRETLLTTHKRTNMETYEQENGSIESTLFQKTGGELPKSTPMSEQDTEYIKSKATHREIQGTELASRKTEQTISQKESESKIKVTIEASELTSVKTGQKSFTSLQEEENEPGTKTTISTYEEKEASELTTVRAEQKNVSSVQEEEIESESKAITPRIMGGPELSSVKTEEEKLQEEGIESETKARTSTHEEIEGSESTSVKTERESFSRLQEEEIESETKARTSTHGEIEISELTSVNTEPERFSSLQEEGIELATKTRISTLREMEDSELTSLRTEQDNIFSSQEEEIESETIARTSTHGEIERSKSTSKRTVQESFSLQREGIELETKTRISTLGEMEGSELTSVKTEQESIFRSQEEEIESETIARTSIHGEIESSELTSVLTEQESFSSLQGEEIESETKARTSTHEEIEGSESTFVKTEQESFSSLQEEEIESETKARTPTHGEIEGSELTSVLTEQESFSSLQEEIESETKARTSTHEEIEGSESTFVKTQQESFSSLQEEEIESETKARTSTHGELEGLESTSVKTELESFFSLQEEEIQSKTKARTSTHREIEGSELTSVLPEQESFSSSKGEGIESETKTRTSIHGKIEGSESASVRTEQENFPSLQEEEIESETTARTSTHGEIEGSELTSTLTEQESFSSLKGEEIQSETKTRTSIHGKIAGSESTSIRTEEESFSSLQEEEIESETKVRTSTLEEIESSESTSSKTEQESLSSLQEEIQAKTKAKASTHGELEGLESTSVKTDLEKFPSLQEEETESETKVRTSTHEEIEGLDSTSVKTELESFYTLQEGETESETKTRTSTHGEIEGSELTSVKTKPESFSSLQGEEIESETKARTFTHEEIESETKTRTSAHGKVEGSESASVTTEQENLSSLQEEEIESETTAGTSTHGEIEGSESTSVKTKHESFSSLQGEEIESETKARTSTHEEIEDSESTLVKTEEESFSSLQEEETESETKARTHAHGEIEGPELTSISTEQESFSSLQEEGIELDTKARTFTHEEIEGSELTSAKTEQESFSSSQEEEIQSKTKARTSTHEEIEDSELTSVKTELESFSSLQGEEIESETKARTSTYGEMKGSESSSVKTEQESLSSLQEEEIESESKARTSTHEEIEGAKSTSVKTEQKSFSSLQEEEIESKTNARTSTHGEMESLELTPVKTVGTSLESTYKANISMETSTMIQERTAETNVQSESESSAEQITATINNQTSGEYLEASRSGKSSLLSTELMEHQSENPANLEITKKGKEMYLTEDQDLLCDWCSNKKPSNDLMQSIDSTHTPTQTHSNGKSTSLGRISEKFEGSKLTTQKTVLSPLIEGVYYSFEDSELLCECKYQTTTPQEEEMGYQSVESSTRLEEVESSVERAGLRTEESEQTEENLEKGSVLMENGSTIMSNESTRFGVHRTDETETAGSNKLEEIEIGSGSNRTKLNELATVELVQTTELGEEQAPTMKERIEHKTQQIEESFMTAENLETPRSESITARMSDESIRLYKNHSEELEETLPNTLSILNNELEETASMAAILKTIPKDLEEITETMNESLAYETSSTTNHLGFQIVTHFPPPQHSHVDKDLFTLTEKFEFKLPTKETIKVYKPTDIVDVTLHEEEIKVIRTDEESSEPVSQENEIEFTRGSVDHQIHTEISRSHEEEAENGNKSVTPRKHDTDFTASFEEHKEKFTGYSQPRDKELRSNQNTSQIMSEEPNGDFLGIDETTPCKFCTKKHRLHGDHTKSPKKEEFHGEHEHVSHGNEKHTHRPSQPHEEPKEKDFIDFTEKGKTTPCEFCTGESIKHDHHEKQYGAHNSHFEEAQTTQSISLPDHKEYVTANKSETPRDHERTEKTEKIQQHEEKNEHTVSETLTEHESTVETEENIQNIEQTLEPIEENAPSKHITEKESLEYTETMGHKEFRELDTVTEPENMTKNTTSKITVRITESTIYKHGGKASTSSSDLDYVEQLTVVSSENKKTETTASSEVERKETLEFTEKRETETAVSSEIEEEMLESASKSSSTTQENRGSSKIEILNKHHENPTIATEENEVEMTTELSKESEKVEVPSTELKESGETQITTANEIREESFTIVQKGSSEELENNYETEVKASTEPGEETGTKWKDSKETEEENVSEEQKVTEVKEEKDTEILSSEKRQPEIEMTEKEKHLHFTEEVLDNEESTTKEEPEGTEKENAEIESKLTREEASSTVEVEEFSETHGEGVTTVIYGTEKISKSSEPENISTETEEKSEETEGSRKSVEEGMSTESSRTEPKEIRKSTGEQEKHDEKHFSEEEEGGFTTSKPEEESEVQNEKEHETDVTPMGYGKEDHEKKSTEVMEEEIAETTTTTGSLSEEDREQSSKSTMKEIVASGEVTVSEKTQETELTKVFKSTRRMYISSETVNEDEEVVDVSHEAEFTETSEKTHISQGTTEEETESALEESVSTEQHETGSEKTHISKKTNEEEVTGVSEHTVKEGISTELKEKSGEEVHVSEENAEEETSHSMQSATAEGVSTEPQEGGEETQISNEANEEEEVTQSFKSTEATNKGGEEIYTSKETNDKEVINSTESTLQDEITTEHKEEGVQEEISGEIQISNEPNEEKVTKSFKSTELTQEGVAEIHTSKETNDEEVMNSTEFTLEEEITTEHKEEGVQEEGSEETQISNESNEEIVTKSFKSTDLTEEGVEEIYTSKGTNDEEEITTEHKEEVVPEENENEGTQHSKSKIEEGTSTERGKEGHKKDHVTELKETTVESEEAVAKNTTNSEQEKSDENIGHSHTQDNEEEQGTTEEETELKDRAEQQEQGTTEGGTELEDRTEQQEQESSEVGEEMNVEGTTNAEHYATGEEGVSSQTQESEEEQSSAEAKTQSEETTGEQDEESSEAQEESSSETATTVEQTTENESLLNLQVLTEISVFDEAVEMGKITESATAENASAIKENLVQEIVQTESELAKSSIYLHGATEVAPSSQVLEDQSEKISQSTRSVVIIVNNSGKKIDKINNTMLEKLLNKSVTDVDLEYIEFHNISDGTTVRNKSDLFIGIPVDKCEEKDFEANNNCLCNIQQYLHTIAEKVKNKDEIHPKTLYCYKFIRPKDGLLIQSNSKSLTRKTRSLLYLKNLENKHEVVEHDNLEGLFREEYKLDISDKNIFALPGTMLEIPCKGKADKILPNVNDNIWIWHSFDTSKDEMLPEKSNILTIHHVTTNSSGNYSCYKEDDKENPEKIHVHELEVITFPIYNVQMNIFYQINSTCELSDADVLYSYLPKIVAPLLCSNDEDVCTVLVERPRCLNREDDTFYNVSISAKIKPDAAFFNSLDNEECNINCKLMVYNNIVTLVNRNAEAIEHIPVHSDLPSSTTSDFIPHFSIKPNSPVDTRPPKILVSCPGGFGLESKRQSVCVVCPKQTFSMEDEAFCKTCPPGQYQPHSGSKFCIQCNSPVDDSACLRMLYSDTKLFKIYVGMAFGILIFLIIGFALWSSSGRDQADQMKNAYFEGSLRHRAMKTKKATDHDLESGVRRPLLGSPQRRQENPPELPPVDF